LYFFATILTQLQREADPPERELLALLFGDFAPTTSNFCHCTVSEYFVAARERGKKNERMDRQTYECWHSFSILQE
jgi:hypothetical protein